MRHQILFKVTLIVTSMFLLSPAYAEKWVVDSWNASAATGVPEFHATKGEGTFTVISSPHGIGVQPKFEAVRFPNLELPDIRLFISVTAPIGSLFDTMQVRAADNVTNAKIVATLYRQKMNSSGKQEVLGVLATKHQSLQADGFQILTQPLKNSVEIMSGYSYYIEILFDQGRLQFTPSGSILNLTVFDVGLSSDANKMACFDGIDNDYDGKFDCHDPDCSNKFPVACLGELRDGYK